MSVIKKILFLMLGVSLLAGFRGSVFGQNGSRSSLGIATGAFIALQNSGVPNSGPVTLEYHLREKPLFELDFLTHHPFGRKKDDLRLGLRILVLSLRALPTDYSRDNAGSPLPEFIDYRNFFYGLAVERRVVNEKRWQLLFGGAMGFSSFAEDAENRFGGEAVLGLPETRPALEIGMSLRSKISENDRSRNFIALGPRLLVNFGDPFPFGSVLLLHLGFAVEMKE